MATVVKKKATLTGYIETVDGACGVGVASGFAIEIQNGKKRPSWQRNSKLAEQENLGGCGWLMAGFINTPECRAAYSELLKRKDTTLLFQTPIRVNENTGREFFMCLYDTGKKQAVIDEVEFV